MPGRCSTDAVCKRKHVVQLRTIKRPKVYVQKLLFFASNEAGLKPQPYISSVFLRAATFLKIAFKFQISRFFFFISKLPANQRSLFIYLFIEKGQATSVVTKLKRVGVESKFIESNH